MSTLKVDTIQSSTVGSPVTINDTLAIAGNTAVTGTITGTSSFKINKDGSDTIAGGPFFDLANAANTRQWAIQLSASNYLDFWYYNGSSWATTVRMLDTGLAVTGTLSATGTMQVGAVAPRTGNYSGVTVRQVISGLTNETAILAIDGYGTNRAGVLELTSSDSATVGVLSATGDTRIIGAIDFVGVNSSSARTAMAYVELVQSGAAGATYNAGVMNFSVGTNAAAPSVKMALSSTGLAVTGAISATINTVSDDTVATFSNPNATGGASVLITRGASNVRCAQTVYAGLWYTGVLRRGGSSATSYSISSNSDISAGGNEFLVSTTGVSITGTLSATGITSVTDVTDATSTTAASLKTAGGLGVAKKLYVGDNIVMSSGKGIDFSATANGSGTTTSEVLSDYEEGTFTPFIADNTGSASEGQTYSSQIGTYTKIGNRVFFTVQLTLTSLGTLTTTEPVELWGLPFTSLTGGYNTPVFVSGSGLSITAGTSITGFTVSNATRIALKVWDATGGTTGMLVSELSATGALLVSGHYFVSL